MKKQNISYYWMDLSLQYFILRLTSLWFVFLLIKKQNSVNAVELVAFIKKHYEKFKNLLFVRKRIHATISFLEESGYEKLSTKLNLFVSKNASVSVIKDQTIDGFVFVMMKKTNSVRVAELIAFIKKNYHKFKDVALTRRAMEALIPWLCTNGLSEEESELRHLAHVNGVYLSVKSSLRN